MTDPTRNKLTNRVEKGRLIAVIGGASLLIAATFGVQAVAENKTFQHAKLYVTESVSANPFTHKAHWGKRDRFSQMTPEEIESKITRAVKHVAIEIDATPEQQEKITALMVAVARDMQPLRNTFRASGKEIHDLLKASTIDRAALEKIRTDRLADADRASRELFSAIADVAEVLTPEQRATLDERIEEFRGMRKRWHRG